MADQARFTSKISSDLKHVDLLLSKDVVIELAPQSVQALRQLIQAFEQHEWLEVSLELKANHHSISMGIDPYMPVGCPDAIAFLINGETWNITAGDNYHWILQELRALSYNIMNIRDETTDAKETRGLKRYYMNMYGQRNCLSVYPRGAGANAGYELGIKGGYAVLRGFYDIAQADMLKSTLSAGALTCKRNVENSSSVKSIAIAVGQKRRQWHVTIVYHNGTARGFDLTPTDIIGLYGSLVMWIGEAPLLGGPTMEEIRTVITKAYKEHPFAPLKPEPKPEPNPKPEPPKSEVTATDSALGSSAPPATFVDGLQAVIREIVRDELCKAFQTTTTGPKPWPMA